MKRFSVVLVVLAVIFASQNVFSGQRVKTFEEGKSFQTKDGHVPLEISENWKPYFPKDTIYSESDRVGGSCDGNGNYIQENTINRCKKVHSPSTGRHYRIRKSREGDFIFLMKDGKPVPFVHLNSGSKTVGSSNHVLFISPEAERYAESNGYVIDKRNNTMVAKGSSKDDTQVAQQPKSDDNQVAKNEDCASKGSTLEKAKCIGEQSGAIGAVIKGLPKF